MPIKTGSLLENRSNLLDICLGSISWRCAEPRSSYWILALLKALRSISCACAG